MASGIQKKLKISAELEAFSGVKELSRAETMKVLWDYIKANNLQNPENKKEILPDAKLATIIGKEPINMMKMAGALAKHFVK